nr:TonB-dependent receptor plug domain-containing protein [Massilia brevitalea]
MTREKLSQERFANLTQALERLEGIDVGAAADKTGGMQIVIRGIPSDYTLIMIDGRRQNAAGNVTPNGSTGTQNSFMPPLGAIERIEVIRGPMSTLFGSDAMGGVVNIITRKVGKRWMASLSGDYTAQEDERFGDQHSARLYLSGPLREDMLGLSMRGSTLRRAAADIHYLKQDGTRATPAMGANPGRSEVDNLGLRLAFTPDRQHTVMLDADSFRQRYDNSRGQLGTLGIRGGYGPEQEYTLEQVAVGEPELHVYRQRAEKRP